MIAVITIYFVDLRTMPFLESKYKKIIFISFRPGKQL